MAPVSFYSLQAILNNGETFNFNSLKGKKVLIVNTASDCGFTKQYEGLQELHENYKGSLQIIGFPSNEFGQQEKGSDEAIEKFCKINFGVCFPLVKKSKVTKGADQHKVYKWLTEDDKNGWNYVAPSWNFCKYLVNEKGDLTHFFDAAIEPMGKEIQDVVKQIR